MWQPLDVLWFITGAQLRVGAIALPLFVQHFVGRDSLVRALGEDIEHVLRRPLGAVLSGEIKIVVVAHDIAQPVAKWVVVLIEHIKIALKLSDLTAFG